jgi:hypothetical protein
MNVVDQFVVGVVELGEQHKPKARSRVLETENINSNQQQDSTTMHGHKLNKATENENCGYKGYRIIESIYFF